MEKELQSEITRCESLLKFYEEIPEGVFGATIIKQSISEAKKARTESELKKAIKELKGIEG